jgi:hypothetical protein
MNRNLLVRTIPVFFVSYVILLLLFSQFGQYYFKPFEGIFRWEIDFFFPQFKVSSLQMEEYEGQQMVSLTVRLTENIIKHDGTVLHSMGRPYTSKTIAVNEYLHPIIIFAILAAWPAITLRDRFKVLLLVLPFLLVVEMLDIPIVLATRSDETMRANLLNDPLAGTGLASYWVAFMHTGGRAALSILAIGLAFGCLYLGQFWQKKTPASTTPAKTDPPRVAKVGRNDPCPCGSGRKYKNCCGLK